MTWITRGRRSDADALGDVMFRTIRYGARAYTLAQRQVWAPKPARGRRWANRLTKMEVWVTRTGSGPVGFLAMLPDGYVDFAYVAPEAQGRGVFGALMRHVTDRHPGLAMSTHASLHAQPAFSAQGFSVVQYEVVLRQGQRLRRALMTRSSVNDAG